MRSAAVTPCIELRLLVLQLVPSSFQRLAQAEMPSKSVFFILCPAPWQSANRY